MLKLTIPGQELYNEESNTFIDIEPKIVTLNHNLITASKWESKFKKPFISEVQMTDEETIEYIRMMCSIELSDSELIMLINMYIDDIKEYIGDTSTATIINVAIQKKTKKKEVLTTELLYFYIASFGLDISCETWHLSRLLTILAVANIKNSSDNTLSEKETVLSNKELNEQRKQQLKTEG